MGQYRTSLHEVYAIFNAIVPLYLPPNSDSDLVVYVYHLDSLPRIVLQDVVRLEPPRGLYSIDVFDFRGLW